MKNYKFAAELIKKEGIEADVITVLKNNVKTLAISIGNDNVKICVYPPEELTDSREIADYVLNIFHNEHNSNPERFKDFSMEDLKDWDLCTHLFCKTGNEEMLSNYIHRDVADDLCEVLYLKTNMDEEIASTGFVWKFLELFNCSVDELFEKAHENNYKDSTIVDMKSMLFRMSMVNLMDIESPVSDGMAVISNKDTSFGAANILDPAVQKCLQKLFPEGYFLIPSSVHEWIAASKNINDDPIEFARMIQEVNSTQVDPREQLSNHPYMFMNNELVSA